MDIGKAKKLWAARLLKFATAVDCPKCGATTGQLCVAVSGRTLGAEGTHAARLDAVRAAGIEYGE